MALELITGPTNEPVTLETVKAQLRLDVDTDDALLRQMMIAAREWIEGQTRRCLLTQTWDYYLDYDWPWKFGRHRITFPLNPVQSVSSIVYVDGSSPNPTLASSQYTVVARKHGSYIEPAYGVTWSTLRCVPNAIKVRFVAGYTDDTPQTLLQALVMLVAHLYENREVTTAKALVEIPYGTEALLSPLRGASL